MAALPELQVVRARNWVAEAIEKLGGSVKTAADTAGVRLGTMYSWRRQGYITLLEPAARLAKATGIPISRFIRDRDGR